MLRDTTPDVEAVRLERLRRMTPAERVAEGERLCRFARQMMRAGIRQRHPDYDDAQVECALARLLWGEELYAAVSRSRPGWPMVEP